MKKKKGLTAAEHQALAAELRHMHDRLVKIEVELGTAYSTAIGNRAGRARVAVDELRNFLDNLYFKENPKSEQSPYYGSQGTAGANMTGEERHPS